MTVKDTVYLACMNAGITPAGAAKMIGKAPGNLYRSLSNNDGQNMKVDELIKIMDACNCAIVVQASIDGKLEEWLLDGESDMVEFVNPHSRSAARWD